jgi:hypothetical protein
MVRPDALVSYRCGARALRLTWISGSKRIVDEENTVPAIVPVSSQNGTSRANRSQIGRSAMCLKAKNLREKTTMVGRLDSSQ